MADAKIGVGGAPTRTTILPEDPAKRKKFPIASGVLDYFPDALVAVSEVSQVGNDQHNPGQPLHWARGKSMDQMNTAFRHMWDYGRGTKKDTDGQYHLAKAIWRLSAQLQLDIEAQAKVDSTVIKRECKCQVQ